MNDRGFVYWTICPWIRANSICIHELVDFASSQKLDRSPYPGRVELLLPGTLWTGVDKPAEIRRVC